MTAAEIVDRIKQTLAGSGVTWAADTVDTFKAGTPETPVTGIATTFMATFDAIQRAVAAGANFVISHEPTFYNHLDATAAFADDAVFKAKMAFIEKHQVVVFRFHDHWHRRRPDGMRVALLRLFGWPDAPGVVALPPTTLGALASDLQKRLDIRAIRVVGDPNARVTRVALGLGYGNPQLNCGDRRGRDWRVSGGRQRLGQSCLRDRRDGDRAAEGCHHPRPRAKRGPRYGRVRDLAAHRRARRARDVHSGR